MADISFSQATLAEFEKGVRRIPDGKLTPREVERLASCATAPILELNHYRLHGNLTVETAARRSMSFAARGD